MTKPRNIFDELKTRGEEFFTRMSGELMSNPQFTRAMRAAWWGKEKLDQAVAQALKGMSIPTRSEFKRIAQRVAELEAEVERLKKARGRASGPSAGARRRRRARPRRGGTRGATG